MIYCINCKLYPIYIYDIMIHIKEIIYLKSKKKSDLNANNKSKTKSSSKIYEKQL